MMEQYIYLNNLFIYNIYTFVLFSEYQKLFLSIFANVWSFLPQNDCYEKTKYQ